MKKRDNFTTLGHYGGRGMKYMSKIKQFNVKVKRFFYSIFII